MKEPTPQLTRLWIALILFAGYGAYLYAEKLQGQLDKSWLQFLPYLVVFVTLTFAYFWLTLSQGTRMKNPLFK